MTARNITVYGCLHDMPNASTIVTRPEKGEPFDDCWRNAHDADGDKIYAWLKASIPGRTFDRVRDHFFRDSNQDEWRKECQKQVRINEDLQDDLKASEELRDALREHLRKAREEKEQLKKKLAQKRADCLHLIRQARAVVDEDYIEEAKNEQPVTERIGFDGNNNIVYLGCETMKWISFTERHEPGWLAHYRGNPVWICEEEVEELFDIKGGPATPPYDLKLALCATKEPNDAIECDVILYWTGETLYHDNRDIATGYEFDAWLESISEKWFNGHSFYLYVKASKVMHNA